MADPIVFHVDGVPLGQPRARARARRSGSQWFAQLYDPGDADAWKYLVAAAGRAQRPASPFDGPLMVHVVLYLPRPQRLMHARAPDGPVYATVKPDVDNATKAIIDALTNAGWWLDDKQVVDQHTVKFFHAKSGRPGATLYVLPLAEPPAAIQTLFDPFQTPDAPQRARSLT